MDLAGEFQAYEGRLSQIERILKALDDKDRRDFINALNDPNIPSVAISRVMQRRGYTLDARRVSDYRNGFRRLGEDGNYVAE